MEREFWKESAASLRESISEHKRLTNKKSSEKRYKKSYKEGYKEGYEPKDLLKTIKNTGKCPTADMFSVQKMIIYHYGKPEK